MRHLHHFRRLSKGYEPQETQKAPRLEREEPKGRFPGVLVLAPFGLGVQSDLDRFGPIADRRQFLPTLTAGTGYPDHRNVNVSRCDAASPMNGLQEANMAVQICCPNLRCRKLLSVPDSVRGKMVKCLHCQTVLRVPGDSAATRPAAV